LAVVVIGHLFDQPDLAIHVLSPPRNTAERNCHEDGASAPLQAATPILSLDLAAASLPSSSDLDQLVTGPAVAALASVALHFFGLLIRKARCRHAFEQYSAVLRCASNGLPQTRHLRA